MIIRCLFLSPLCAELLALLLQTTLTYDNKVVVLYHPRVQIYWLCCFTKIYTRPEENPKPEIIISKNCLIRLLGR